jgi:hypothetical protein
MSPKYSKQRAYGQIPPDKGLMGYIVENKLLKSETPGLPGLSSVPSSSILASGI